MNIKVEAVGWGKVNIMFYGLGSGASLNRDVLLVDLKGTLQHWQRSRAISSDIRKRIDEAVTQLTQVMNSPARDVREMNLNESEFNRKWFIDFT